MSSIVWGLKPKLHYAGTLPVKSNLFFTPLHHHPNLTELLITTEGSGEFVIDGNQYYAKQRSLIIYNQGVWHEERALTPFSTHFLGFSNFKCSGLAPGDLIDTGQSCVVPLGEKFWHFNERFRELTAARAKDPNDAYGVTSSLLQLILSEITAYLDQTANGDRGMRNAKARHSVSAIKRFLEEHYQEPFDLNRLADTFHMDRSYLSRTFKQEVGISPVQYFISYRIGVARYYLESTDDPVTDIAERVGYQSVTHFQNVFKRSTGRAPGQYRSEAKVVR